jgi:hypothetical protein
MQIVNYFEGSIFNSRIISQFMCTRSSVQQNSRNMRDKDVSADMRDKDVSVLQMADY